MHKFHSSSDLYRPYKFYSSSMTVYLLVIFPSGATLAFSMAEYTVSELQIAANVCVELTGYVDRVVIATVCTVEGSAVGKLQSSAQYMYRACV